MTAATGGPTAVTNVSARMRLCATPSQEPVCAVLDTEGGAVRAIVKAGHMERDANRTVSVRMALPVTM